ncbi:MAG: RecX family transcriptional regulator [bacterium]|nr:RecX family transcriptional regulator [bacterium]
MPKRPLHPGRRQDDRLADPPSRTQQPGLPEEGARLLAVRREGETVWLAVDGGVTYELTATSVPAGLPEPGGELGPALHREVALAAERKRVARRLFSLLDRRLYPVARLRQRLLDEGSLPEAVEAVVAAMQEQGVHSDRRYADAWCRDCLLSKAVGRRYLEAKLREAGLAAEVARQAAADALDGRREEELALQAAASAWRRQSGPGPRETARVVRFLVGRGFAPAVASRAARQVRAARPSAGLDDD